MNVKPLLSVWVVVFLLACDFCHAAEIVTINPSDAVIVTRTKGSASAEELQRHLKLIAGVDVSVEAEVAEGDARFKFVFGGQEWKGTNDESCAWEAGPDGVRFLGNSSFAVLDFLENALGVRWPEGDFVSYVRQNPIRLLQTKGAWSPELRVRRIRGHKDVDEVFSRRMRSGGHDRPSYGHAFTKHWAKYGLAHRDYFAMREDGVRGPVDMSAAALNSMNEATRLAADTDKSLAICCTSTGLVSQVVADWVESNKGKRRPSRCISLCENDVEIVCHCPACEALDVTPAVVDKNWQTHFADRYVWFGNRVLEEARKILPDAQVCYYAYNRTTDAPARERPAPGTIIGLVPTYFSKDYIADYVSSWQKAGAKEFFYRPNRHHYYNYPYLPVGAEEHFFDILQYFSRQGSIGFDYDARPVNPGPGFEWRERYILYHAMQDPSKTFDYWDDHYCAAYGAAAADVKAYFRYWREDVWKKRLEPQMDAIAKRGRCFNFARGFVQHFGDYMSLADYDAVEPFIVRAEQCKALEPSQAELVRRLRIAHDHSRLLAAAILGQSKEATEALAAYRRAHGYPLYVWSEQYYGDITGMEKFVGPDPKKKRKKGRKW